MLLQLLLQLIVLLLSCRVAGSLARRLGQTPVVEEMLAGVVLGPSLLGAVAPDLQAWLFPTTVTLIVDEVRVSVPHPSMTLLFGLSQLGLVLFMFVIGLELNTELARGGRRQISAIAALGVVVPLVLGGALGWTLARDTAFFPPTILPHQAALFLGAAMAVTAFPVLARIIREEGIVGTRVGTLALAAAASNDAVAWSLLALVVAATGGPSVDVALAIGGGAAYGLGMLTIGRRLLGTFARRATRGDRPRPDLLAVLLLLLLSCAWLTEAIGMHAVFGAFVCGAVMPRGRLAGDAADQIGGLAIPLLLPIFFVYSGLNTHVGLLLESSLLPVTAVIIVTAFVCKGAACALGGRLAGATWRESAAIGALMNARGLMELILLNIGMEKGLIGPGLFTALVVMTLATTAAASPLFRLCWRAERPAHERDQPAGESLRPVARVAEH